MKAKLTLSNLLVFFIPLSIISLAILLSFSQLLVEHPNMAMAITCDLTITLPLVYLFLIWKKSIPKITAVPVFILGIVLSHLLLPVEMQGTLSWIKSYILPAVEITVFSIILYTNFRIFRRFQKNKTKGGDYLLTMKKSIHEVVDKPILANAMATESSMFYYAILGWKKPALSENEFTLHKKAGVIALYIALIFIMLVETVGIHFLAAKWSIVLAWILSISSVYLCFQILAHINALGKRRSYITDEILHVKYGLFGDLEVQLNQIEKVEFVNKNIEVEDKKVESLSILKDLEKPNMALHFQSPQTIMRAYGIQRECDVLLLHVDEKEKIFQKIQDSISSMDSN